MIDIIKNIWLGLRGKEIRYTYFISYHTVVNWMIVGGGRCVGTLNHKIRLYDHVKLIEGEIKGICNPRPQGDIESVSIISINFLGEEEVPVNVD